MAIQYTDATLFLLLHLHLWFLDASRNS